MCRPNYGRSAGTAPAQDACPPISARSGAEACCPHRSAAGGVEACLPSSASAARKRGSTSAARLARPPASQPSTARSARIRKGGNDVKELDRLIHGTRPTPRTLASPPPLVPHPVLHAMSQLTAIWMTLKS